MLAEYCNGTSVTCPNWLSQWGSEYLGAQGYYPYEILTYYYGNNINLATAPLAGDDPISYPGRPLGLWSEGIYVKKKQAQLNSIATHYPLIPKIAVDGIYGPKTANSVKTFQQIFNLPQTGIIDFATWYAISRIYVGVNNIAEL